MNTTRNKIEELKELGWDMADIHQLLNELKDLAGAESKDCGKATELSTKQKLTQFLTKMGFGSNLKGFNYIREAILYCVENGTDVPTTKVLYPEVAKKFDTTASRVERAIRHSVERAYDNGSPELLELTGYTVSNMKGKPTNSEIIALVADNIREGLL